MELLNFFLKTRELENIGRMVLDSVENLEYILLILDKDPDWLENNSNREISCLTLLRIIERGYHSQKYESFLTYIIDVVDGDCINDLTFEKILIYPQLCVREKMLISLAHKKLNENQLRSLCDVGIAFECYFELAILYYTEKRYKLETLKAFIQEFSKCKYSYMLDELIFELTNYYIASEEMKCEYINGIGCGL